MNLKTLAKKSYKKAQGLSINTVVIAVIVVIALIIIVAVLASGVLKFGGEIKDPGDLCEKLPEDGKCEDTYENRIGNYYYYPDPNNADVKKRRGDCCIKSTS